MDKKNELLIRVYIVFVGFVLFAGIIFSRVIKISLLEGSKWRDKGGVNVKWIEVEGERGNIYDINGNLLATSLPYFDIYMDLLTSSEEVFSRNIEELSLLLSTHFTPSKPSQEWRRELVRERNAGLKHKKPGSRYYPLLKNISKDQLDLLETFPILKLGQYKGGLITKRISQRVKPFKELCARTIGVDRENASKIGIEGSFDKVLKGDVQRTLMHRVSSGLWLPLYDPLEMTGQKGRDVITTLDMHLQDVAHRELLQALMQYKAEAGTVVIMDVKTGAIKSLVNLGVNNGTYSEMYNYAIGRLSEPGSTFKLATVLALMEEFDVSLDREINLLGGRKKFYDREMKDSETHGKFKSSLREAFEISSNVGVASAAQEFFGSRDNWLNFRLRLDALGVTAQTGIEIEGEPRPYFKHPEKDKKEWYGTTVPWMAHGYELMMTPLQVLNLYNSVANDGRMMKPYLVSEIVNPKGKNTVFSPKVLKEHIAGHETIAEVQELLASVVERGTGSRLKLENISFAGKTGTTSTNYAKEGETKAYNASFAGYFPAEDPVYSMIVVVYQPHGAYYGSQVAGPVFRNIVKRLGGTMEREVTKADDDVVPIASAHSGYRSDYDKVLEFTGIPFLSNGKSNWVELVSKRDDINLSDKPIEVLKVPDVRGMGLRDATYVLENLGLRVLPHGVGKVKKQTIRPGEAIRGQQIELYLN